MKKELKKEEIENLSYKDIAALYLENGKKGIKTLDLFKKIVSLLELPSSTIEDKIADFYTSLATDKRFILVDGLWDLRKRHTSDKVIVDETDEEDEDEEIDDNRDDLDISEDEFDSEYSDDTSVDNGFDDSDEDDLADLVIIDEEELNE